MKERKPQDRQWIECKKENERINRLLFTGWDGGKWRKGIMARLVFKGLIDERTDNTLSSE